MEPTSIYGYRYRPLTRTLHGKGASLVYYQLWINPGPRASSLWISVLFRLFLLLASSPEITKRARGSQDAFGTLLTPKQTTVDTPLTAHAVGSVYSENKFIAGRACWKKADILRCHPWFPREMYAVFSGYKQTWNKKEILHRVIINSHTILFQAPR